MRKVALALVAVVGLFVSQNVEAQTATAAATASITIPTLLQIDVSNAAVAFGTPTFADYDIGSIAMSSAASVVSTRGNVVHSVTVAADAATMTYSGSVTPAPSKPASDLEWTLNGTDYAGLLTGGAAVASGLVKGVNATAATVSYRMLLDDTQDAPGTYSLAFTFTVVAD